MTASSHLTRKPKARGSTVAWLTLRDQKIAELVAETEAAKRSAGTRRPANAPYASPKACYDTARDIRAVRAQYNPEAV